MKKYVLVRTNGYVKSFSEPIETSEIPSKGQMVHWITKEDGIVKTYDSYRVKKVEHEIRKGKDGKLEGTVLVFVK